MSSPAHPMQAPAPKPPAAPPETAPKAPRSGLKWLLLAALLVGGGVAWWMLAGRTATPAQPTAAAPAVRTVKVVAGTLQQTIRVAGSTSARNFANIVAPQMRGPDSGRALILIKLVKSGSFVKKGEVLAQIDAQSTKDHVDDVHAMVVAAEADIRKRQAEQAISLENVRQELRVAKADLDKAELDYRTAEIRTPIDMEILKLAAEEARENYTQLEKNLALTQQLHASEVRILQYTRDRHARHRDRHASDVERFTIHSPMGGLAVMNQFWRSGEMGQIQEGDQVAPGQPFMKVVDTSTMQLDATVNQVDGEVLRMNQAAVLEFDAFPGLRMKGHVAAIGAMGIGGWRQNYYIRNIPVRVAMQGNDSRVIPDLSGAANVILSEEPNATLVPLEAVHLESGKAYVYVKSGNSMVRREVQLGKRNDVHTSVVAGLKPGEEVAVGETAALTASR